MLRNISQQNSSLWRPSMCGLCTTFIPLQRVKGFLFTPVWQKFGWTFVSPPPDSGSVWQDGAGRDPDARWLLRRRDVGTEDARHWPPQRRVAESHRGNPHRRSHAQACGETRYACTQPSRRGQSGSSGLLRTAYLKCIKQAWANPWLTNFDTW